MRINDTALLSAFLALAMLLIGTLAYAQNPNNAPQRPTSFMLGPLGLNTVPSARMDETGTIRATISTLDPYLHTAIGLQIADPVNINIRQTGEISRINGDPERLYPGIDLKLRLLKESAHIPETSIFLGSALGHARMAGEALIASKKWNNFDFTGGVGWGRYGSAGHFDNPLKMVSSHFSKKRDIAQDGNNDMQDWFTGEKVGFFGGMEYFTPIAGLSLKADIGADRYSAETSQIEGFHAAAPWSVGATYRHKNWADFSVGIQGTDKVMARLNFTGNLKNFPAPYKQKSNLIPMRHYRTDTAAPKSMEVAAQKEGIHLYKAEVTDKRAHAFLRIDPNIPTPVQLHRAAVHMANHAGASVERISITPVTGQITGTTIHLPRKELEKFNINHQGSAEEIWQNTEFTESKPATCTPRTGFFSHKIFAALTQPFCAHDPQAHKAPFLQNLDLTLKTQSSLGDEDYGALYRSSIVAKTKKYTKNMNFIQGFGLRLNVADNLDTIKHTRPQLSYDIRSDIQKFANQRLALEEAFLAKTHSFKSDLHIIFLSGYLEEMFAGAGTEILYRPFNSRLALGAEAWLAQKRDPDTTLNLGIKSLQSSTTAHLNLWYDSPALDMTIHGKVGRYLAGDFGGTIALVKNFHNGIKLEAYTTVTDLADINIFGNPSHFEHGLRLNIPLSGFKFAPKNTHIESITKPFGRNMGQSINSPMPLYELTEPLSQPHIIRHWDRMTP